MHDLNNLLVQTVTQALKDNPDLLLQAVQSALTDSTEVRDMIRDTVDESSDYAVSVALAKNTSLLRTSVREALKDLDARLVIS